MDLTCAIGEFAEMLAVSARALERLVGREMAAGACAPMSALLGETEDIALRLSVIANELRQADHSVGAN